jgi:hypothetical protein
MADKTSFTQAEWTLLLESPMIAGMAVTAADPSGLWGLLKESFAGGSALTRAVTSADTNALVKDVVTDFSSSEGRSAARDGLKAKFASSQPADLKKNRSTHCDKLLHYSIPRPRPMPWHSNHGFGKSVKAQRKLLQRAVAYSGLAEFK